MKVTFTMVPHVDRPKHSTRFNFEAFDSLISAEERKKLEKFNPSFYVPKPLAENAKRIRVTIEEV